MPRVQNLDGFPPLVDAIIHINRRVQKPPDIWLALDSDTNLRKGSKKIDVIEEVYGKLLSAARMLLPGPDEKNL